MKLTKAQAVAAFGGTQVALARALGISKSEVCKWPLELTERQAQRVISLSWRMRCPIVDRRVKRLRMRPMLDDLPPSAA
jgi:DNA-binding transcriptional regulator YdaS (Cro superfamily)